MPKVTLIPNTGRSETASGGCFGFTGRGGDTAGFDNISSMTRSPNFIETFRYHIGEQFNGAPVVKLRDPLPYLKWLEEESAWAKYIKGSDYSGIFERHTVDIKTDIPGHCVIGTASAVRLASHGKDDFIPFFNRCIAAGGEGAVALLVFYALGRVVYKDTTVDSSGRLVCSSMSGNVAYPSSPQNTSGMLSLSDDEVIDVSNVSPGLLYSFIKGDYEMIRNDGNETMYANRPAYTQHILASFRAPTTHGNRKNLGKFLLDRFHTSLTSSDVHRMSSTGGSMGASRALSASRTSPVSVSTLVGWVLQLTFEIKTSGRFLGWRT
jgi:hypothetical protein